MGGGGNMVEQVIGRMPPNLQSVPGGGPPGDPPPPGNGSPTGAAAPVLPDNPFLRGATASQPMPFAPWANTQPMPLPMPFGAGNPFTSGPRRY